ncbi:hypothetical protein EDB83DRAFT_2387980 [Lactarius deliciosus]|nr:hypothetical protein EDB83DRAFT_2387980 [Lactarius deliciosus]
MPLRRRTMTISALLSSALAPFGASHTTSHTSSSYSLRKHPSRHVASNSCRHKGENTATLSNTFRFERHRANLKVRT